MLRLCSLSCYGSRQMEGMASDLQLAREMQTRFTEWKKGQATKVGLEMTVTVLTTGYWPTYKVLVCCVCCISTHQIWSILLS